MEDLTNELILIIAKFLPISSIYNFSLCSTTFRWLIDYNLLFKYLCQRDFNCSSEIMKNKHVLPEWDKKQKLVYKTIEYLRQETANMKEYISNIPIQIISIQHEDQQMMDGLMGVFFSRKSPSAFKMFNITPIRYINLNEKCALANTEYSGEGDFRPYNGMVLIAEEGLALWNHDKKKYYLVYELEKVKKILYTEKIKEFKEYENLTKKERIDIKHSENEIHNRKFGFLRPHLV